jgi:hypothetical protein
MGRQFMVFTDNCAVSKIFNAKEPSSRVIRWINFLSEFDVVLKHRAGKDNIVADFLSRNPTEFVAIVCNETKNFDITFEDLEYYFKNGDVPEVLENDKRFRNVAKQYLLIGDKLYRKSDKGHARKVLYSLEDLYIILRDLHDSLGHFGFKTIWDWIRVRYWRPKLYFEVKHYVMSCTECQQFAFVRPSYKFDGSSNISGIFDRWVIDFVGPFPESKNGYSYCFVLVEAMTGWPLAVTVRNTTADVAMEIIGKNVISVFGTPKEVVSDRNPFSSERFRKFCKDHKIYLNLGPGYQPEWVGLAEKFNSVLRYALMKLCKGNFEEWDIYVERILWGYRIRKNSRTGYSPYYLLFGREPSLPYDEVCVSKGQVKVRDLEMSILPCLRNSLTRTSTSSSKIPKFEVGKFVWVLASSLRKGKLHPKAKARYTGPYKILNVMEHNLYEVEDEAGKRYVYHVSRLISYVPRIMPNDSSLTLE